MNIEVLYFEVVQTSAGRLKMVRETLKSLGRQEEIYQVKSNTQ